MECHKSKSPSTVENIHTSIADRIENPLRRTSEHIHIYICISFNTNNADITMVTIGMKIGFELNIYIHVYTDNRNILCGYLSVSNPSSDLSEYTPFQI